MMKFAGKSLLTSESVCLCRLLADIARLRATFGLEPSPDAEDEHGEALSEASTAFRSSKKVMARSSCA